MGLWRKGIDFRPIYLWREGMLAGVESGIRDRRREFSYPDHLLRVGAAQETLIRWDGVITSLSACFAGS